MRDPKREIGRPRQKGSTTDPSASCNFQKLCHRQVFLGWAGLRPETRARGVESFFCGHSTKFRNGWFRNTAAL
jgi:hypothetical protein